MSNNDPTLVASVNLATDSPIRDEAVSPNESYIVQAPAGSGKTALLVRRYLNLLTVVKQPEEILAITFTEKAAREMKSRVLKELTLKDGIAAQVHERSKRLHWDLELNPQRMKIQTIDSFAYGIVQRMPIECQLSLDYQSMEKSDDIYYEAAVEFFEQVLRQGINTEYATDILALFENNIDQAIDTFASMLSHRQNWIKSVQRVLYEKRDGKSDAGIFAQLEATRNSYVGNVIETTRRSLPDSIINRCKKLCRKVCRNLAKPFHDFERIEDWATLANVFLTSTNTFRKVVNVRQGFPPKSVEKQQWSELSAEIKKANLIEVLQRIHGIPGGTILPRHREAFDSLCLGLPSLIQKLNVVFQRRECIDFSELSFAAQRALERDEMPPELALALDYRISHILIDEYQDTSDAQFAFFERIMTTWNPDSGNSFFAVGDPMQSIYRFRNANLSLFQRTFNQDILNLNVRPRKLNSNFRSIPSLVDFNNRVFQRVFGIEENADYGQVAFAESVPANTQLEENANEDSVNFVLTLDDPDGNREAQQVALRIEQLISSYGSEDKIALLVPTRTRLAGYFDALKDKGIQWKGIEILKLEVAPVVRDLYSLVEAVNEDRSRLAWLSVFRSPLCGLALPDLEKLAEFKTGSEMLTCTTLSTIGLKLLARVQKAVLQSRRESHLTLRSQVERLWFRLGGKHAYEDVDSMVNAERFFELLESTTEREIRLHDLWSRVQSEYVSESGENADLDIMTIHKAKGLEFDHVLLVDISNATGSNPRELVHWAEFESSLLVAVRDQEVEDPFYDFLRREEKARDANENKRLLYVAMTRAKKTLSIFGRFSKTEKKPRSGSLLALLEPIFDDATEIDIEPETSELNVTRGNLLTRIDPSYEWVEPTSKYQIEESLKFGFSPEIEIPAPPNFRQELVLGKLVHRELNWLSQTAERENVFSTERIASWQRFLRAEGLRSEEIALLVERTQEHLNNVLNHDLGQWIISPHQNEACSETAYTAILEGRLTEIVIDRTFIDDADVRWIIDFKTTTIGEDVSHETLLRDSENRHGKQLSRYASVLQLCDPRAIKCGVYYTDIPLFVEVEVPETHPT
ncbi:MAG: AAA family ATPase [Gammaproteobacteria bacterium]|nr:AAA family ATPase [Gammaproteobacteria bacterium]